MSHLPKDNPLVKLRQLVHDMPTLSGITPTLDALEIEQARLKQAFREKALVANQARLRVQYLQAQVERLEAQRRLDEQEITRLRIGPPPAWEGDPHG